MYIYIYIYQPVGTNLCEHDRSQTEKFKGLGRSAANLTIIYHAKQRKPKQSKAQQRKAKQRKAKQKQSKSNAKAKQGKGKQS